MTYAPPRLDKIKNFHDPVHLGISVTASVKRWATTPSTALLSWALSKWTKPLLAARLGGREGPTRETKLWIAGAIQRNGGIKLERIPNTKKGTLHDFINRTVKDEARSYLHR